MLLITTAEKLGTAEAHRIGLIDRVYPRAEFDDSWRALARRIAASPSRSIKSVIARAAPHHHPGFEGPAAEAFAELWVSEDHWAAAGVLRKATS
jgi:enoyl-CoA hydratase/carnithine racemase